MLFLMFLIFYGSFMKAQKEADNEFLKDMLGATGNKVK